MSHMSIESDPRETYEVLVFNLPRIDGTRWLLKKKSARLLRIERYTHLSSQDILRTHRNDTQARFRTDQSVRRLEDGAVSSGRYHQFVTLFGGSPGSGGGVPRAHGLVNLESEIRLL